MKILISGSCGFIFSNIVLYLMQHTDFGIVSIDKLVNNKSFYNAPQNKRHKLYIGDVCDGLFVKKIFEIENPDIVIHGATNANISSSLMDSSEFIKTAALGTYNMLEASRLNKRLKLFINTSIDEVYGKNRTNVLETDLLNPSSPYASAKASSDLLGQSYFNYYCLPVITMRCCNGFGPRQNRERFVPKTIISLLQNKELLLYNDGNSTRTWLYIKDLYYALMIILEKGQPGSIYNVGSSFTKTNKEMAHLICRLTDKNFKDVVQYSNEPTKTNDERCTMNYQKLKELGWEIKYDLENALSHCVGWYKANPWSYQLGGKNER